MTYSNFPAQPVAHAASHDPLEIVYAEPRHFFGEYSYALAQGARQPRDVRAPEHAPRPEAVVHALDVRMQPAVRVTIRRIVRQTSGFDRNVRMLCERQ